VRVRPAPGAPAPAIAAASPAPAPQPPPPVEPPSVPVAAAAPPAAPPVAAAPVTTGNGSTDEEVIGDVASGIDLQALAKGAAMRAERQAIDQALVRFRWNRRKAARYLGVSYKTLLNKMKECGISASS